MKHGLACATVLLVGAGCSNAPPPAAKKPEPPAYFKADPQTGSTVSGKVSFTGPRPRRVAIEIDEDPACARMNKAGMFDDSVAVQTGGALSNVFIHVTKGLEGKRFAPPPEGEAVTIDQKRCQFAPRVLGLRVGQTLRVTNSDPVTHNIHPQARMNREWNQSQPEGAPALERKFARPETMIRVKCNVHSWMRAYVGAVEHPYFAVTGADGSFEIRNLPPGDYTLEAWHEKLGTRELQVHVDPSSTKTVAFSFPPGV